MDISDKQWDLLKDLIAVKPKRLDNRGRPRQAMRSVLNGILWILRIGALWKDLPNRYPPYQTGHRYFQEWVNSGTWDKVLWKLAKDLIG